MSYNREARTAFANRAFVLSEMFNTKFRNTRFSGAVSRVVRVIPPETESTGGGKMARETITLVPESEGAQGAPIVAGWLDVGQNLAELRAYSLLAERHKERFGNLPFDLNPSEYATFLQEAQSFLAQEGITLTLLDENTPAAAPAASAPAAPARSGSTPKMQVMSANTGTGAASSAGSGGGVGLLLVVMLFVGVLLGVGGAVLVLKLM